MIRTSTTRQNVAYSVQSVAIASAEAAGAAVVLKVREVLDQKLEEYPRPAKMIVYCRTVEATEALAAELNCDAYFREVDNRDGKAERLQAWTSGLERERYGGGRVIVATNALGLGIDIPDIRVVMHLEMPFEMADYAQQSGHAGRDGDRSEAIVIRAEMGGQKPRRAKLRPKELSTDDYISGKVCRRVVLDSVMDGRESRSGCEEGEEFCDLCQAQSEIVELDELEISEDEDEADLRDREMNVQLVRSRVQARAAEEQEAFEVFKQRLEERVSAGCLFCSVQGLEETGHIALECQSALMIGGVYTEALHSGLRMERFMQRDGVVERFGCCFACFVPQELCNTWEEDVVQGGWRKRSGGDCRYKGVMASTIAYIEIGLLEGLDVSIQV
ncbi:hypothetical protein AUP68_08448 [Ilyonectria robusta]